ncbi:beta-carotene 3-hydroxylase, chloroplastic isoform X2 [Ricinus communis]|uniref:beta-carotene 3-hydroxylase, chloroplastic isoform X2 n=1 Tax=Ricinus communis TaxID=3988 RepID=UPI0007724031|nr:beta-carotene 3-hydroxylase, chloroplastic isoform X2 [Ricinus communis]|eukprot:XP_015571716.1 beta-carotene 3-hydroxylase, chloroplastic isoform X2 [Ricinus communis]
MATAISATSSSLRHRFGQVSFPTPKSNNSTTIHTLVYGTKGFSLRKNQHLSICLVMDKKAEEFLDVMDKHENDVNKKQPLNSRVERKLARKKLERFTYLVAAILSSTGITSIAAMSVYYRFSWQMEGGEFPALEMFGTFALSVGAAVGMEFWARWAHRALWHASLWKMHESHHKSREGPFELNDVFAIINAVPAIALLSYGFNNKGLLPGLCFGAGLGITVFGMAYMFVHDGLVHRRFSVGPIANVPYLRRVAAAHQELEEKEGGLEALHTEVQRRIKASC